MVEETNNTAAQQQNSASTPTQTGAANPGSTEAKFTQADVERLINERIERAEKRDARVKADLLKQLGLADDANFDELKSTIEETRKRKLDEKRCTGCGEIKPSSEFYSTNYGKSKIKSRCKCCTIAAKPKSKRVPKCRIFSREDLNKEKNDRRRKLVAGNGGYFTATDIAHMRYIQQGHCCYCGRVGLPLHLDHVIPITKGGPSDPWNLALCCRSCNSSKGDRLLEEWTNRWYLR